MPIFVSGAMMRFDIIYGKSLALSFFIVMEVSTSWMLIKYNVEVSLL